VADGPGTGVLEAKHVLEFPYTRSTGPVLGAFLAGLKAGRVLGVRASDGRVIVPPQEYDPVTAHRSAVRPAVRLGARRLDGADTPMLHALDVTSPDDVSTGMRVRIRWAEERPAPSTTSPASSRTTARRDAPSKPPTPVTPSRSSRPRSASRWTYRPGFSLEPFLLGTQQKKLARPALLQVRQGLPAASGRLLDVRGGVHRRAGRGRARPAPSPPSRRQRPFAVAGDRHPLHGGRGPVRRGAHHRRSSCCSGSRRRRPHGHARPRGLEGRRRPRADAVQRHPRRADRRTRRPYESYADHGQMPQEGTTMRDVAIVSFAQATPDQTRSERIRDCCCRSSTRRRRGRPDPQDIGFTCSGSTDYLAGQPFSFVAALDAVGPVAADRRVPRRDGRRVGAVRGVAVAAVRRHRHRAGVRLRQVLAIGDLAGLLALQLDPYTVAAVPDATASPALQARALLDAGARPRPRRGRRRSRRRRAQPLRPGRRPSADELLAAHRTDPLRARLPAVTDGCGRGRARRRRPRPTELTRRCGSAASTTASSRRRWAARPHRLAVDALAAEAPASATGPVDVAELHAPFPTRSSSCARARLSTTTPRQPVRRGAGRQPGDGRGPDPHRRGRARHQGTARADRAVAHATSGPCLQQNLVCVLEVDNT
jgi:uncharacterized OB-fold protein